MPSTVGRLPDPQVAPCHRPSRAAGPRVRPIGCRVTQVTGPLLLPGLVAAAAGLQGNAVQPAATAYRRRRPAPSSGVHGAVLYGSVRAVTTQPWAEVPAGWRIVGAELLERATSAALQALATD